MPVIKNIPEDMITEHVNWHTKPGKPSEGGRIINPRPPGKITPTLGSGEEFLVWHKGYLERFKAWVDSLPSSEKPSSKEIEPWTEIPSVLKMGMVGWDDKKAAHEARLADMSSFGTLDELGRFLEWGLHGWLHNAGTSMFNEPILGSWESPRVTYFWQLHGLIDHWRQQWNDSHT